MSNIYHNFKRLLNAQYIVGCKRIRSLRMKLIFISFIYYIPICNTLPLGIINRILSAAGLTIENSNYQCRMVDHPFIADLKASSAVSGANISNQICAPKHCIIPLLPVVTPSTFKALIRTCANQFDILSLIPEAQHNLCGPNIDTPCHPRNKHIDTAVYCFPYLLLQPFANFFFRLLQFFRSVSGKARSVYSLLRLCTHNVSLQSSPGIIQFIITVVSVQDNCTILFCWRVKYLQEWW
nr:MAG TPA: hypothetical protein [Caudoviricetes sp.]